MRLGPVGLAAVGTVLGVALWTAFNLLTGVREPWDHSLFWVPYALALAGAGILGAFASSSAWIAGLAIMLSMLPVMVAFSSIGPLIVVGIVLLFAMSVPTMIFAQVGWLLAKRFAR